MTDLFDAHSQEALRLAYLLTGDSELARDVTQDAFIRLFGRFRDKVAPEGFSTYLRRTIVNLCKDHWRRQEVARRFLKRRTRERLTHSMPMIEERDEQWELLRSLPTRQRAAIVLRFYEDLSEQQTAEVLGCSVGAVKGLVSRGTDALRKKMEVS